MVTKTERGAAKVTPVGDLLVLFLGYLLALAAARFVSFFLAHKPLRDAFEKWKVYYLGTWEGLLSLFGGAATAALLHRFVVKPLLSRLYNKLR